MKKIIILVFVVLTVLLTDKDVFGQGADVQTNASLNTSLNAEAPIEALTIRPFEPQDTMFFEYHASLGTALIDVLIEPSPEPYLEGCVPPLTTKEKLPRPLDTIECCCYLMTITSTEPPGPNEKKICKIEVTSIFGGIDPFCCIASYPDPWHWNANLPVAPSTTITIERNPLHPEAAITPTHPQQFIVCGRNTEDVIMLNVKVYDCYGNVITNTNTNTLPASLTCYPWNILSSENEDRLMENYLTIYPAAPNPANTYTRFAYEQNVSGELTITVFDAAGKKMLSKTQGGYGGSKYVLNIATSSLPEGSYFAAFTFNGYTRFERFIVKH